MRLEKTAAGVLLLAFNAAMLWLALSLPPTHSRGDVGTGFMPILVAVGGLAIAAFYLFNVYRGTDRTNDTVSPRGVVLLAIFAVAVLAMTYIGLPAALALAAGAAVLIAERGQRWWIALAVVVGVAVIAKLGFGWLLNVPLP
ncbi:tripartite tricarboxylate transporter TctB family protein [Rhizobium halophytocola]|uniref:4-amino-4-deoxy-L-arabinose transferase-like glycosyltransferase n=1 Tax=Rhizobium halophytocola TaxID=735519 RepID=A0ABS4DV23_9HYPH|nr:tripartite tricarboxylate transporter TctB family protein [Rhizobium halophytocola]MBP1849517.1 4-amino-4-deoxy-L-arabinose transferase-like glycosyltransferase [Rhizobium halophytocola]